MVGEIDQQEVRRQGKEQDVGSWKCHSETHYLANFKNHDPEWLHTDHNVPIFITIWYWNFLLEI